MSRAKKHREGASAGSAMRPGACPEPRHTFCCGLSPIPLLRRRPCRLPHVSDIERYIGRLLLDSNTASRAGEKTRLPGYCCCRGLLRHIPFVTGQESRIILSKPRQHDARATAVANSCVRLRRTPRCRRRQRQPLEKAGPPGRASTLSSLLPALSLY